MSAAAEVSIDLSSSQLGSAATSVVMPIGGFLLLALSISTAVMFPFRKLSVVFSTQVNCCVLVHRAKTVEGC